MAFSEIAFERLHAALETTRGTAIGAPTILLNLAGRVKPFQTIYHPQESRGTLVKNYRSKVVRKGSEWQGEGPVDVNELPFLLNMAVAPLTSPTTPGTLSKLWAFTRSITSDNIKSATFWDGDPNIQSWQTAFAVIEELKITNDASSEEVAKLSVKGQGRFPTKVSAPTPVAAISGDTLPGQLMQCWIDTSSAIGTTAVTGRLVSAEHTIQTGVTYKYLGAGPTASLDFAEIGREATEAETKIVLELPDSVQYDQWAAQTSLKIRVRHNGAFIETVTAVDYYNYVEFDIYGPFDALDWGENADGSNRTVQFTVKSQYDATLAADWRLAVQNQRTSLV